MYGLTIGESKSLMLKYLDEYSVGGEIISRDENADYLNRHNAFADTVQMSLAQLFPLGKVYAVNQRALGPLILAGGFGAHRRLPGEDFVLEGEGAGAYYFEISGDAVIYVEERRQWQWQILREIKHQGEEFAAYRDNLTLQIPHNRLRLRFSGGFACEIKNACLYRFSFPTKEQIPQCRPWMRYEMPGDFLRLHQVVAEDKLDYAGQSLFYWENERTLVLPHDLSAQISVHYWAYPPKIDDNTPDEYLFPLAPDIARLIPLKVAALIIPGEKAELSRRLLQLYEQELLRIRNQQAVENKGISSVYTM